VKKQCEKVKASNLDQYLLSLIDKTSVANVIAAVIILAGVISVFLGIESNEMLLLITGAGIGYLFKNGIVSRAKRTGIDPNTGQPFTD